MLYYECQEEAQREETEMGNLITVKSKDGRALRAFGLRKDQIVETELGPGKCKGISLVTSHVNTFELRAGKTCHMIDIEMEDGTMFRANYYEVKASCPTDKKLDEIVNDLNLGRRRRGR